MNRAVYAYLLRTYGRRPQYWLAFVCSISQTLLMRVISVVVIANLAKDIAVGDLNGAKRHILTYFIVALLGLSLRLAKEFLGYRTENQEYRHLMVAYYRKLVGKDVSFYRDHQTGYLATTFRQHADAGIELVRLFRGDLIQTPISLVVPTAILIFASWPVGLAALVVVIVQIIYIIWSSSVAHGLRAKSHEVYRKISATVSDDVTNIIAYKTSGLATSSITRIKQFAREETTIFWKRRMIVALLDAPREIITVTGTALAFWMIVDHTQATTDSIGLIVLTVTYMFQIFQNITLLPELITRHDDLVTKLYPTLDILTDSYEQIKDPPRPQPLRITRGQIDISHISFSYRDTRGHATPIFTDFDLHIRGGEQVGIVGLSGAGKSTLASLLMRFDDIDAGEITIDSISIRSVAQDELRSQIAYVPQEPLLFHRSIRENLQYFDQTTTEEALIRAARAAHAHEFIEHLPKGYDTLVGERGIKLSGGQKQRIVIARAILKNAPIMLFDEATSALDSESEKIIQQALPEILDHRTAIVIAHRLSTVAGLDRIVVMHEGRVVEQGTHNELLALGGRYQSLWQKQTANE